MAEIKKYIQYLAKQYELGTPVVSDEEYDALSEKYGHVLGSTGEIPHFKRMFSLKKHYEKDGQPPLTLSLCTKSPKLDGAAVSLLYINGELKQALTRGDGILGRDITDKLELLVPTNIVSTKPTQITGEVVASKKVTNSRNFASGALNLKSVEEFEQKVEEGEMIFVAYGLFPYKTDTFESDMEWLRDQNGFATCLDSTYSLYPQDGEVYRLNSNAAFDEAGHTDKFPHGAFALKQEAESVVTTLLDVVWSTGKSGKVTPVAILEPVMIGDAKVSRATLNNIEFIEALELEIGCQVEVIRSGEIIPKIIGRAD